MLALASAPALAADKPARKPDLADAAQGVYAGDVISDARGSSKEGVTVTVNRIGANRVELTSDYARIPTATFRLQRAMNTIQNVGGASVFVLDLSKSPRTLQITIDDASWAGTRKSP